jgi:hypothetical protein
MKLETSILGTLFGFSWLSRRQEEMGALLTPIAALGGIYALTDNGLVALILGLVFWFSWGYWMAEQLRNIENIREEILRELAK